jgi:hypothetical protein
LPSAFDGVRHGIQMIRAPVIQQNATVDKPTHVSGARWA